MRRCRADGFLHLVRRYAEGVEQVLFLVRRSRKIGPVGESFRRTHRQRARRSAGVDESRHLLARAKGFGKRILATPPAEYFAEGRDRLPSSSTPAKGGVFLTPRSGRRATRANETRPDCAASSGEQATSPTARRPGRARTRRGPARAGESSRRSRARPVGQRAQISRRRGADHGPSMLRPLRHRRAAVGRIAIRPPRVSSPQSPKSSSVRLSAEARRARVLPHVRKA